MPSAKAWRAPRVRRQWSAAVDRGLTAVACVNGLEPRLMLASTYYAIKVVDSATGRGVPQVDLVMTDGKRLTTDDGGTIAFNRSGYMNTADTFVVESYGYKLPSGTAVTLTPVAGQSGTVSLTRTEIAERLYRETGENRYSQTVAVGGTSPITYPNRVPGDVFGQDSGLTAVYKGKLYEFWGDTARDLNGDGADDGGVAGKYRTTGGVMSLPANGGLDPDAGENIDYIRNTDGTLKEMFPSGNGFSGPLDWASSPMVAYDASGNEKLVIGYSDQNGLSSVGNGFAVFDDSTQQFKKVSTYSTSAPIHPGQNAFLTSFDGVPYYVIPAGNSLIRVRDTYADITNINSYQVYTPLKPGSVLPMDSFLGISHVVSKSDINYDANGNAVWTWAANTSVLNGFDYSNLANNGYVPWAQNPFQFKDADSSDHIDFSTSAVSYDPYLKSYTLIGQQTFGTSGFGEVWYAQSKSLLGPWTLTRKVQTDARASGVNDSYTFYNLIQHPEYSRDGKSLYYSGTYTNFLVDGGLQGEYFTNSNLTGYAYKANSDTIDATYGNSSPNSTLVPNKDNFSVRWTGNITFGTKGAYQFRVSTDAGAKLVVNGTTLVNNLTAATDTTYTGTFTTSSANQTSTIELDYASLTSTAAHVKLEWLTPGSTTWATVPSSAFKHNPAQPQENYNTVMYRIDLTNPKVNALDAGTGLTAQVFDNADFTNYKTTLANQSPNTTFADGASPAAGVAPTSYSIRYTGLIRPANSETYTFYATSDEGVRVWIDGQLIINDWAAHAATTDSGSIALQAGRKYDIRVEYYNGTGAGQLKLEWSSPSLTRQTVPTSALYPSPNGWEETLFDDTALTQPKLTTLSPLVNVTLPVDNAGTPDPSTIAADGTWGARWQGQVRPDYTGAYTFSATSDDGIRVWVNGTKLVDLWSNHGDQTASGTINLQAGQLYDVVVEYYNDLYTATAKLMWSNADQTGGVAELVPQENVLATTAVLGGTTAVASSFAGASLFYNNSAFDGNDPTATAADDAAIATDKAPLLPGNVATFANYSSYSKGINGVMIDIANLPAAAVLSGADFDLRVGNTATPATWAAAPAPTSITVRRGAGVGGTDRVTLVWPDGAIAKEWLEVTAKADANTGLLYPATFGFGNAIGETNGGVTGNTLVNATDAVNVVNHPANPISGLASITNPYDFNRDRLVNATDSVAAVNNTTSAFTALVLLNLTSDATIPAAGNVVTAAKASPKTLVKAAATSAKPLVALMSLSRPDSLPARSIDLASRTLLKDLLS